MKYLHIIGALVLTIITLGGYARYQANKAKFAKSKEKQAGNALNNANNTIKKRNEVDKQNAENMQKAMESSDDRTYFDEYGDGGLSDSDIL